VKRGRLVGAWAHVQREGRRVPPTFIPIGERLQTKRDGTPTQTWSKMPATMILKCARAEQWRQGWPNIFGGQYVAEEMPLHEEIDVTPPKAADNRATTDKLADELARGAGAKTIEEPKPPAPTPASKSTVTVTVFNKPEKQPDPVEERREAVLGDVVTGAAPTTTVGMAALKKDLARFEIIYDVARLDSDQAYCAEKAAEVEKRKAAPPSNVVPISAGVKTEPKPEKLPHEVADEKKAAAADEGPVMVYGGEHKGKHIRKLDGPTIIELMKLGNEKLKSLDEKKKAKVVQNLAELKQELDDRDKRLMAQQEQQQNATPMREPGDDVE
jgi:hypothetical protein